MTSLHKLIAFGVVVAGGTVSAVWGSSIILDACFGFAALGMATDILFGRTRSQAK
jgi:hypothetical protein